MMLAVAVIVNSGPEIGNRCTEVAGMYPMAAVIAKSGLEIENQSSAIVPASRIPRLRKVVDAKVPRPILFFLQQSRTVSPAKSLPQSRTVRLRRTVAAAKNGPPAANSCGAGGDRMPRRRHNPK